MTIPYFEKKHKLGRNLFSLNELKAVGMSITQVKDDFTIQEIKEEEKILYIQIYIFNFLFQRHDLGSKFVCQAGNSKDHPPKSREVELMIRCKYTFSLIRYRIAALHDKQG